MTDSPLLGRPDVFEVSVPVATVWSSPDAPRDTDQEAVLDVPDVPGWADSMDGSVRKGLNGRTLTQLLLGEGVQVTEERGDWVRVVALLQRSSQDARGYPGWMRRAHLAEPVTSTAGAAAFVMTRSAVQQHEDGTKQEVSFGTALWVDGLDDEAAGVLLPGQRCATVPLSDVRLAHKRQQPAYGPDDLLASAEQFLGMRYLWGGTSGWGLDCSGLVHLAYRAHGVVVPRDAFDQAEAVDAVPLDEVEPGDLYFFARSGGRIYHVGFASERVRPDGTRSMLHAPETGEFIENAPMARHRLETLVSAGRVRKTDAGPTSPR